MKKQLRICIPPYGKPNDHPAIIDTKTTMKKLPSISELSEISVPEFRPRYSRSKDDVRKVTFNKGHLVEKCTAPCPKYSDKGFTTSRTSTIAGKDIGVQKSKSDIKVDECWCDLYDVAYGEDPELDSRCRKNHRKDDTKGLMPEDGPIEDDTALEPVHGSPSTENENSAVEQSATDGAENSVAENSAAENYPAEISGVVPESTDSNGADEISAHNYACHSSLTGSYANQKRGPSSNQYIFGYDFQTSSSSDLSDEDSDVKTSTSK
ncbi:hypothetical protein JTB14_022178 [Gonioctena quinquepunctata]|nr:hypothetical protein JTB14_022178 [Gonioctena quinquepunctata]